MNVRRYYKCRTCLKIFLRKKNIKERYIFAVLYQLEDYFLSVQIKYIFYDEIYFYLNF